jgi:hypothetical protein
MDALRGVYAIPGLALSLTDRDHTLHVRVYG